MIGNLKKAALAAAFAALAPITPMLSGSASDAQAHAYVSGSVVIGGPLAVVGFSYGNPFVYGHVHYSPVYCDYGPLYYYPEQRVYAHYYPAYSYHYYTRPVHYPAPVVIHHYHHRVYGYGNGHGYYSGRGRTIRGHRHDDRY